MMGSPRVVGSWQGSGQDELRPSGISRGVVSSSATKEINPTALNNSAFDEELCGNLVY